MYNVIFKSQYKFYDKFVCMAILLSRINVPKYVYGTVISIEANPYWRSSSQASYQPKVKMYTGVESLQFLYNFL